LPRPPAKSQISPARQSDHLDPRGYPSSGFISVQRWRNAVDHVEEPSLDQIMSKMSPGPKKPNPAAPDCPASVVGA